MALEPSSPPFERTEAQTSQRDEVELYVRTYSTILRSSGDIPLRAFEKAHCNVGSSLHFSAAQPEPDTGTLIYAVNRLPACIVQVERVVRGQLPERFAPALGEDVEHWHNASAPARRRQWRYDGRRTLAIYVASVSDIDDVIPTLLAYQIEWNKLHARLNADRQVRAIVEAAAPPEDKPAELSRLRGKANAENVLYYAARLWRQAHPGAGAKAARTAEEQKGGITTTLPLSGADVDAQVIELACLRP